MSGNDPTFIASQIFGKLQCGTDEAISSRFSAFFPPYLLDIDRNRWDKWQLEMIIFISRHTLHKIGDYHSRRFIKLKLIGQSLFCPEKILKLLHFVKLLKYSIWMNLGGGVDMWYVLVTDCDMLYFTKEFDWPTFLTVWVMVKKPILWSNSLNFFAPIGFSGKVDFFKIAVINPFMNRFRKRIVDSERPRYLRDNAPFRYRYFEIS